MVNALTFGSRDPGFKSRIEFKTVWRLTLKAPSKLCSRRHSKIFIFHFSEKSSLDISCESSADDSHKISRLVFI